MSEALVAPAPVPWWQRRLCGVDLESTLPDPEEARIVTAAVVHVGGGLQTEKEMWLVDPGVDIPAEATEIHGVTNEQVRDHGTPAPAAIESISASIARAWAAGELVVIVNAPYDLTVIDRELGRHHGVHFVVDGPVIDPKVLDKAADRFVRFHRTGSRRLDALCRHYKVVLDAAHDAAFDAIAACRVAYRIGQRFPALGNLSPQLLHQYQADVYVHQARTLQEHWDRKGDPRKVDSYEWPIRARKAV